MIFLINNPLFVLHNSFYMLKYKTPPIVRPGEFSRYARLGEKNAVDNCDLPLGHAADIDTLRHQVNIGNG